jgi:hypothetical protein
MKVLTTAAVLKLTATQTESVNTLIVVASGLLIVLASTLVNKAVTLVELLIASVTAFTAAVTNALKVAHEIIVDTLNAGIGDVNGFLMTRQKSALCSKLYIYLTNKLAS